ncbi:hypothetical protein C5167_026287 [Papaver somniferum]|uniref:uncharacterized protein LOC113346492 n=1 Tax=Papaver somniferum TaxID=3469 RepID=UPI000E6F5C5C|nr:uncharacterized protein LOC113346492 [Papaver somniferum]RZC94558.1 hypothetical protein C5167_026287 [Papaver somniferum]
MAIAAAAIGVAKAPSSIALFSRQRTKGGIFILKSSFSAQANPTKKLILYSKPGCCLCDGLKEKLQAAFILSGPDSLHDVQLQVRDITTNPQWENAYQYEIPVLARVRFDGTEETLPRLSPRLGVELVQKKLAALLRQE